MRNEEQPHQPRKRPAHFKGEPVFDDDDVEVAKAPKVPEVPDVSAVTELPQDVVPSTLVDDPVIGDGSAGRAGYPVSNWRIHRLKEDELVGVTEPEGRSRRARKARRAHAASRKARSGTRRKTRGRVRLFVAILLVAAIAGVVYAGVTYSLEIWGGKTIPNVVGLTQDKAIEELEKKGLKAESEEELSDSAEGHVIEVDPSMGERVADGTVVHLTIGKSRVIPKVKGKNREEAVAALEAVGATNIRFERRDVLDDRDIVLEVRPKAGSVFMSSDEVVLVVSQNPVVPDILGMSEAEAKDMLDREGIPSSFGTERLGVDERLKVVKTSPEVGESVGPDGVSVTVGDALINVLRLADYFDAKAPHINEFLVGEGMESKGGKVSDDDHISANYQNSSGDSIAFLSDPWSQTIPDGSEDVMRDSAHIEGVRFTTAYTYAIERKPTDDQQKGNETAQNATAQRNVPTVESHSSALLDIGDVSVGKSTANAVMDACGFYGMQDSCTQNDITLPKGVNASGRNFYCCYGENDGYVWTVLINDTSTSGASNVQVMATCAPKAAYTVIDLSAFGDQICDFVAYWEVYA